MAIVSRETASQLHLLKRKSSDPCKWGWGGYPSLGCSKRPQGCSTHLDAKALVELGARVDFAMLILLGSRL